MATAGAGLEARRETSGLVGTWLFVISDALAFVALLATMLALGDTRGSASSSSLGSAEAWGSTALLLGMSVALLWARHTLALALALGAGIGFVLWQLYALGDFFSQGFFFLEGADERLVVVKLAYLAHVVIGLVLLAGAVVRREAKLKALSIYLHYLVVVWLVVFGLFYLA